MDIASKMRRQFAVIAGAGLLAAGLIVAGNAAPAYASDVGWNDNVAIVATADDPTYDNAAQYIDVTVTFGSSVASVDATAMTEYLQANITIAGRTIASDSDSYTRAVSDVAIDDKTVTFKIGPNTSGMTANYSGEFYMAANATQNSTIASAMGGNAVETLVANGITIQKDTTTETTAKFTVLTRAQARGMNHILITDVVNGKETAIFQETGTFSNGGITIHSHSFMMQTQAVYASTIVSTGNSAAASEGNAYEFVNLGNGQFSVSRTDGVSCANVKVYVYDCNYLNAHSLAVGEIYEPEWDATELAA